LYISTDLFRCHSGRRQAVGINVLKVIKFFFIPDNIGTIDIRVKPAFWNDFKIYLIWSCITGNREYYNKKLEHISTIKDSQIKTPHHITTSRWRFTSRLRKGACEFSFEFSSFLSSAKIGITWVVTWKVK